MSEYQENFILIRVCYENKKIDCIMSQLSNPDKQLQNRGGL